MRIGQGYDVHRLTPGRRLVLGGTRRVLRMLGIAKEARGGCRRK